MDSLALREVVTALCDGSRPSYDILQTLSKSDLDQVQEIMIELGYTLIKAQAAKPANYKVPGVESTGHIPEDHPERELVVNHINKLNNLPDSHPLKQQAMNVARMLHERHIAGDKVINDKPSASPTVAKPQAEPHTIDYSQHPPRTGNFELQSHWPTKKS